MTEETGPVKTIEEKIEQIKKYQACGFVHPLTCSSGCHTPLVPVRVNDKIILICNNCNYTQDSVPECILRLPIDEMEEMHNSIMKTGAIE